MVGVHSLTWSQVSETSLELESERLMSVLEPVTEHVISANITNYERGAEISRVLIPEFGLWIWGWNWSSGDGGLIHAYSPFDPMESAERLLARVQAAVEEWRRTIIELRRIFDELHRASVGIDIGETASLGVARLMRFVIDRTDAEDAWYSSFTVVLGWFLESETGDASRAKAITDEVLNGRFSSWIEPRPEEIEAAAASVADCARRKRPSRLEDSLKIWQDRRRRIDWSRTPWQARYVPTGLDAHQMFIERYDALRSSQRAKRMTNALARARELARGGASLTLEVLAELQQMVLDGPASYRTTDAYAHGGNERYGFEPNTLARFADALEDACDVDVPTTARAARVYLDVCYFHPFADGNARAARLALDFVLTTSELGLKLAEPVFMIKRSAKAHHNEQALLYLLHHTVGRAS